MTIKSMSEISGLSETTVREKIKQMFPEKIKNGMKTVLSQSEAILVMAELRKKGFIQPSDNREVPSENREVESRLQGIELAIEKLLKSIPMIVSETVKAMSNQTKMIEIKQDYYSIQGYSNLIHQQITFSDALRIGREAAKISREKGVDIRKIPDERHGLVNSYHISILEEVFQI